MSVPHPAPLLLGSASAARAALLKKADFSFDVSPSGAHEPDREPGESLAHYVLRLAHLKSATLADRYPAHRILTADTAIELEGRTLGKPAHEREAVEMISSMAGKTHTLCSSAVLRTPQGKQYSGVDTARITFRALSAREIQAYVDTEQPLQAAGAYALQGGGRRLIQQIEGHEDTIIGLHIPLVQRLLSHQ